MICPPSGYKSWKHPELPYLISDEPNDIDRDQVFSFVHNSYWAKGMKRDIIEQSISGSHSFVVLDENGYQTGFARVVTDHATAAYVKDVYIMPDHRRKGLALWLMKTIVDHPDYQTIRRWFLLTSDQHKLYEKVGFKRLSDLEWHMEKT